MSAPRPKRHLNRKNASAEDFTDYEDPPGVELKPSNASTGTIYNFTRPPFDTFRTDGSHPLDIFGTDGSPPSKNDDIAANLTFLASGAGTSYRTAAIASSTTHGHDRFSPSIIWPDSMRNLGRPADVISSDRTQLPNWTLMLDLSLKNSFPHLGSPPPHPCVQIEDAPRRLA